MERTKTEQLLALLRAQRAEAALRAGLIRDSIEWAASSDRLEQLNDQIMHDELFGVGGASRSRPMPAPPIPDELPVGAVPSPRQTVRRAP